MITKSNNWVIAKKEIKEGLVEIKKYYNRIEYWISSFRHPKKGFWCIIVCSKYNYISRKRSERYFIKGTRYTKEDLD